MSYCCKVLITQLCTYDMYMVNALMLEGGESMVEIPDPILSNMENWVHHTVWLICLLIQDHPQGTGHGLFYIPFTIFVTHLSHYR